MTDAPIRLGTVRKHASWMARPDDRILEYVSVAGPRRLYALNAELADVSPALDYPQVYLQMRLTRLAEYGLLRRRRDGTYAVTDAGVAYLSGDLDASELEQSSGDEADDADGEPAHRPPERDAEDRSEGHSSERSVDRIP